MKADVIRQLLDDCLPHHRSKFHLLVSEKAIIQQLANDVSFHSVADEYNFLTSVLVLPLLSVLFLDVLQDVDLRGGSLPDLRYSTQPGTLCLNPDDVSRLLPASNNVVRGGEPEEPF